MIKIGQVAPDFKCQAIVKGQEITISLNELNGKYTVLFFYPLDFTFVCPTELHELQNQLSNFKEKNSEVIAISVDSVHSHRAWLNTPRSQGGIEGIEYPLISDIKKTMSSDYGVLNDEGIALRGLFLLDKNNVVQHITVNNLGLGRNINEALRLIDALQHHEQHGEVCPVNWTSGQKTMKPNTEGLKEYFG